MQALSSSKRKHQKVLDQLISDGPNGHTAPTGSPTSFNLLKAETNSIPHVQYFRITFHTFISAPCYWSTGDYKWGDWTWRWMTSDERSIPLRCIPWNAARLPSTSHQTVIISVSDTGQEEENKWWPLSHKRADCVSGYIFLSSGASISLFLPFIHPLIPPFFSASPVPHPNSFAYSLLIALAQVLNYFQTARQGTAGTQGTIWTYYIKEFMIWNHHSPPWRLYDMTFQCLKLLPSFPLFSIRVAFIPPDDWHWSILESFSSRTPMP